jgi:hypothetical protein
VCGVSQPFQKEGSQVVTAVTMRLSATTCAGTVANGVRFTERDPPCCAEMAAVSADEPARFIAVVHLAVPWETEAHKYGGPSAQPHHDVLPMLQALPSPRKRTAGLLQLSPSLLDPLISVSLGGFVGSSLQQRPSGSTPTTCCRGSLFFVHVLLHHQLGTGPPPTCSRPHPADHPRPCNRESKHSLVSPFTLPCCATVVADP